MAGDTMTESDIMHQYPDQILEPGTVVSYHHNGINWNRHVVLDIQAERRLLRGRFLSPSSETHTVPVRNARGGPYSWIDPEWIFKTEPAGTLKAEAAEAAAVRADSDARDLDAQANEMHTRASALRKHAVAIRADWVMWNLYFGDRRNLPAGAASRA